MLSEEETTLTAIAILEAGLRAPDLDAITVDLIALLADAEWTESSVMTMISVMLHLFTTLAHATDPALAATLLTAARNTTLGHTP